MSHHGDSHFNFTLYAIFIYSSRQSST